MGIIRGRFVALTAYCACLGLVSGIAHARVAYPIVDTAQTHLFSDRAQLFKEPQPGEPFFGQDAQYRINPPRYALSTDGLCVTDEVTGLMWQRSPDTNGDGLLTRSDKLTYEQAVKRPAALNAGKYGGYSDWRLPSIKELYSLILFTGTDPSGNMGADTTNLKPFIDTRYFQFAYGQTTAGERIIDAQYASSTVYGVAEFRGSRKLFGVNFADGRIKGYDLQMPNGVEKTFFVQCVRGNPNYGKNDLKDNGDKTVTDRATGLMWLQQDSKQAMNWQQALAWAQQMNRAKYLGYADWRLPSAKELQSIVDYTRSPDATRSPACDPLFTCTGFTNEAGKPDYGYYWTATTHGEAGASAAVYVAFGRALGFMGGWRDVHGAGSQRSDPKSGDPAMYPQGRGPQGDAIRINNFARLVRNVAPSTITRVKPATDTLKIMRQGGGMGPAMRPGMFPGGPPPPFAPGTPGGPPLPPPPGF